MPKHCFLDARRPCTLDCKAAFEVDDPHDPVDCTFLWLAQNLGESVWTFKEALEGERPGPHDKSYQGKSAPGGGKPSAPPDQN